MAQLEGMPVTSSPDASPSVSIFPHHIKSTSSTSTTSSFRPKHPKEFSLDTEYKGPIIPPSTKERSKQRTLVLCFDGTGDQFDNDNSNVVQFFSLLAKGDSKQQLVYYQAGIGTYTIPQVATPIGSKFRQTLDMMLGSSLHHHVMGGYEFLMERYKTGDRICIFGFSRGAYTARALAGMIEKVGLLPAGNHQQVPFAYKMYMKDDELGWQQSVLFKKSFSMDVDIEFVGVWDTVASVGILPKHIPFTKNNTCVKTFRHALSLDEHRAKFKANLYDFGANVESETGDLTYVPLSQHKKNLQKKYAHRHDHDHDHDHDDDDDVADMEIEVDLDLKKKKKKLEEDKFNKSSKLEEKYTDKTKKTDVLEVWFAGCHTDVGGGSVANDTRYSLARIPLRWMVRECFLTNSGIQFAAGRLHEVGLDPHTLYPFVRPRPAPLPVEGISFEEKEQVMKGRKSKLTTKKTHDAGHLCKNCPSFFSGGTVVAEPEDGQSEGGTVRSESPVAKEKAKQNVTTQEEDEEGAGDFVDEEHEELHDALSPAFDQLALAWYWWILEWFPLVHRHERLDGSSVKVISVNKGRPRVVAHQHITGIKVHRSVKMRMETEAQVLLLKAQYKPRVKFDCEPIWVD